MASQMLERVARALYPSAWDPVHCVGSRVMGYEQRFALAHARTAILAMKDPDVTITIAAWGVENDEGRCTAEKRWNAQIDVILDGLPGHVVDRP